MAQTLVQLFVHVVFSTKNRIEMIAPEIEKELFAYIGGIAANNGFAQKLSETAKQREITLNFNSFSCCFVLFRGS